MTNLSILLVGVLVFILIVKNPIWGVAILISLEPIIDLLPKIKFLSSVSVLVGGITLASYFLQRSTKTSTKKSIPALFSFLIVWLVCSNAIGQYMFYFPRTRNWFFTFVQLVVMIWL